MFDDLELVDLLWVEFVGLAARKVQLEIRPLHKPLLCLLHYHLPSIINQTILDELLVDLSDFFIEVGGAFIQEL